MMVRGMLASADAAFERCINVRFRADADLWRQAKRVSVLNVAFSAWVLVYAVVVVALGGAPLGLFVLWTLLPLAFSQWELRRGRSPVLCGNLTCLAGWVAMTVVGALTGGEPASSVAWYSVLPVVATLTCGAVWGLFWTVVSVVSVAFFALGSVLGIYFPQPLDAGQMRLFGFAIVLGLVLCQFIMAALRVGIEQRALAALRRAKRQLRETRRRAKTLKLCYDFSIEDWEKLKLEKSALEHILRLRYDQLGQLDDLDDLTDDELAEDLSDELADVAEDCDLDRALDDGADWEADNPVAERHGD